MGPSVSPRRHNLKEPVVSLGQKLDGWSLQRLPRQDDGLAVKPLDCVLKGRSIGFLQNIGANLNDVVRSHSQEEAIKGRVMQST